MLLRREMLEKRGVWRWGLWLLSPDRKTNFSLAQWEDISLWSHILINLIIITSVFLMKPCGIFQNTVSRACLREKTVLNLSKRAVSSREYIIPDKDSRIVQALFRIKFSSDPLTTTSRSRGLCGRFLTLATERHERMSLRCSSTRTACGLWSALGSSNDGGKNFKSSPDRNDMFVTLAVLNSLNHVEIKSAVCQRKVSDPPAHLRF